MCKIDCIKVVIAIALFIIIQYLSFRKLSVAGALAANIPIFTLFALTSTYQLKTTLLSLAIFTLVISISLFITYFFSQEGKMFVIIFFFSTWLSLSAIAFYFIRRAFL